MSRHSTNIAPLDANASQDEPGGRERQPVGEQRRVHGEHHAGRRDRGGRHTHGGRRARQRPHEDQPAPYQG
jgi:hypothetical protein